MFAVDSGFGTDDARAVLKSSLWDSMCTDYWVDLDFKMGQTDSG